MKTTRPKPLPKGRRSTNDRRPAESTQKGRYRKQFQIKRQADAGGSDLAGQKLNIANALVLTGDDVSRAYKTLLKGYCDAEIFPGGLETINAWVRNKTEPKIEKVLDELDTDSVCVILNAICFRGLWAFPFD